MKKTLITALTVALLSFSPNMICASNWIEFNGHRYTVEKDYQYSQEELEGMYVGYIYSISGNPALGWDIKIDLNAPDDYYELEVPFVKHKKTGETYKLALRVPEVCLSTPSGPGWTSYIGDLKKGMKVRFKGKTIGDVNGIRYMSAQDIIPFK